MLQRHLTSAPGPRRRFVAGAAAAALALTACGGAGDEGTSNARQAILGGTLSDAPGSPVLYLVGPEGGCSAVLVAPTLALTARHCVARTTPGTFSCSASGDLIYTSSGAGQIGADDDPGSLAFYTASSVMTGGAGGGAPDALGSRIIDTQAPSACRDDLAFVALDRAIGGIPPAPLRLTRATQVGELVSVWGYGLTESISQTALRVRTGVSITAVGPDMPSTLTQPAPVRAVRTSPVTCQGDSGGPLVSEQTGAVVALVSLGSQAGAGGPYCGQGTLTDTLGPRLGAYQTLAAQAFAAVGASPIAEPTPGPDASVIDASPMPEATAGDEPAIDDASAVTDSAEQDAPENVTDGEAPGSEPEIRRPLGPVDYRATGGGSCSMEGGPSGGSPAAFILMLVWTAVAVGRRRR